jgi:hypothetical protein
VRCFFYFLSFFLLSEKYTKLCISNRYFSPFHRPQRPLGKVEVWLCSISDLGTRSGWGVSVTPRPHLTSGKDPIPIVQEAGWSSGPVWTGAEDLTTTEIRCPDLPARRLLLYRLNYSAHPVSNWITENPLTKRREAKHYHRCRIKNALSYTFSPPYIFMTWELCGTENLLFVNL